ncbi:MAG: hypothetical protein PWP57_508 [Candidatus Atribacteria bacterium]|nr:hypothetical protein [Candidatus Atribacteria bacterium]
MDFIIAEISTHGQGKLYPLKVREKRISVLFLHHALERTMKWHLTEEMTIDFTLSGGSNEGHKGRYIAHRRYDDYHLIRVVYEYDRETPVLITVYFLYSEHHFKRGKFLRVKYSKKADILLMEFREGNPVDSIDLTEGVILHLDEKGLPLKIEILDASIVSRKT